MMGLKMQIQGFPILSIDTKKTEKIGNMKNGGKEWLPPGEETKVDVYDFGKTRSQEERPNTQSHTLRYLRRPEETRLRERRDRP